MQAFTDWLKHPFSPSMDAWQWFAFYGLILVIALGWKLILNMIEGEL